MKIYKIVNKEEFEKMRVSKLPSEMYVICGALVCGLVIWGSFEKGPDGLQWFFAGAFSMGILMNLFRDKEIDKLSK